MIFIVRMIKMDIIYYKWYWCKKCECWTILSPACGNNCCNAMYGKDKDGNECSICKDAHKYEDDAYKNGTVPKEPIGFVIKSIIRKIFDKRWRK